MKKFGHAFVISLTMVSAIALMFFSNCTKNEALEGSLYVGSYSSDKVYVVDIVKKEIVKTIDLPAGAQPDWLTLSPDGSKLFCSTHSLNQVHVIDTATNTYVDAVNVCAKPKGIAFTPDGSIAAVVQENDISLIDVNTLAYNADTTDTINGVAGTGGIAIHPTLNKLYLPSTDVIPTSQIVYVSDIVGNATPVGYAILHSNKLIDVEINSDGSKLFVSGWGSPDTIHFLDVYSSDGSLCCLITKEMEHLTTDFNYNDKLRLTPDNTRLYIGAYSASMLDYVDLSSNNKKVFIDLANYTSNHTGPRDIAFSPGSSYAFVLIDGDDDLIIILNTSDDSVIDTIPLPKSCDPTSLVYKQ